MNEWNVDVLISAKSIDKAIELATNCNLNLSTHEDDITKHRSGEFYFIGTFSGSEKKLLEAVNKEDIRLWNHERADRSRGMSM